MRNRPDSLNLSNWREPAHAAWAFHHVAEIIPSEPIPGAWQPAELPRDRIDGLAGLTTAGLDGRQWSLQQWLEVSASDALLVARGGRIQHEWYADDGIETSPHIVFSVSKSITAMLAGALVDRGLLDPARPVTDYLPELESSGYRDATVQQVLDMAACIDFTEDYLATSGKMIDYRSATGWHPCAADALDKGLHDFLCSLERGDGAHGETWQYKSPNADLLGWIIERAAGRRLAHLASAWLWRPMGAERDGYVTVDRKGAPRAAGGICVIPRDLLRFAELVRNRGRANGNQVISASWIKDCSDGGSPEAWRRGESSKEFPAGSYRNQWYQAGDPHRCMLAIGIHSQWIYIDPVADVTIVKLSSQDLPLRPDLDAINLQAFANIAAFV